ncbi:hypothetical protein V5O48_017539 [Marasmius crinis-equi]|uniref:C2H2-type domain-containing protein n=1 Tax=Marasmius crinis-equi TaxID=585013 RepID=A0ABR3ENU4_9AGAR
MQSLPSVFPLLITSDAFDLEPTYLSTILPSVDSTGTTEVLTHGNPRQRVPNPFRPAKLPRPPSSAILLPPKPAVAIQIPKSPLFTRRDLPATENNRFSDSSTPQPSSPKVEIPLDSAGTPLTLSLPVATPENAQDAPGPVEFRAPVQNTDTVSDNAVEHGSSDKQAQVIAQWYKPAQGRTARGMCAHDWGKRINGHRQDFETYWRGLPKNNPNEFQPVNRFCHPLAESHRDTTSPEPHRKMERVVILPELRGRTPNYGISADWLFSDFDQKRLTIPGWPDKNLDPDFLPTPRGTTFLDMVPSSPATDASTDAQSIDPQLAFLPIQPPKLPYLLSPACWPSTTEPITTVGRHREHVNRRDRRPPPLNFRRIERKQASDEPRPYYPCNWCDQSFDTIDESWKHWVEHVAARGGTSKTGAQLQRN